MNNKSLVFLSVPVLNALVSFFSVFVAVLAGKAPATGVDRFATIAWAMAGCVLLIVIVVGTDWLGNNDGTWFTLREGLAFTILVIGAIVAALFTQNPLLIIGNVVLLVITLLVGLFNVAVETIPEMLADADDQENERMMIENMIRANKPGRQE